MFQSLDERAKGVFDQVFDLGGAARAQRVEQACGGAPELRARVEQLLAASEKDDAFLNEPTLTLPASPALCPAGEVLGSSIGAYTLRERIGEGGFGTVFRAEQTTPVRRAVALKVIKAGMDTQRVIARFNAERQALAMMDHPNIARVLEAGATESGRPYFVMELVHGEPVTRYCERNRLTLAQRLRLFRDICGAVQHAHQKGVIHRDLKPSNILVSIDEDSGFRKQGAEKSGPNGHVNPEPRTLIPVPKVIDFGIAKATDTRLTDQTLTGLHQMVGTPEYMSPEQAGGIAADIDTRCDIYSLGVLLYELLTGTTPFDRRRLIDSGFDGMCRILREEDPPRPSTRVSASGKVGTGERGKPGDSSSVNRSQLPTFPPSHDSSSVQIAQQRRMEPAALTRALHGDLDWIVLKCLEKDRARRYETASALADDIGRYLDNQPVHATPPSAGYKLSKFVRRNRAAVLAGAAIALTLLAAAGVSIRFGLSEARQRVAAERARDQVARVAQFQEKQLAGIDARTMGVRLRATLLEKGRAASERAKLSPDEVDTRVAEFEKLIAGSDFTGMALETLVDNVFKPALEATETQFADDPLVKARLLQTLASTLLELGLIGTAAAPQNAALAIRRDLLGDDHPDTLASLGAFGTLLRTQGKLTEAEAVCRDVLERRRRILGADDSETLDSISRLAHLFVAQGRLDQGEDHYRQALQARRRVLGDAHPDTLATLAKLGGVLRARAKLNEAEPLCREALDASRRVLGDEHRDTLIAIGNMASLLKAQGKLDEAEPLYREALEKSSRVLGESHRDTLILIGNLGGLLLAQERFAEAEANLRESLSQRRRVLGDAHPDTLTALMEMGSALWTQGKRAEAEPYFRESLEKSRHVLGDGHRDTLTAVNNMGVVLRAQGKLAEAETYFREAVEKSRVAQGNEHPDTLLSIRNLGKLLLSEGKAAEAIELLASAEPAARRAFTSRLARQLGEFLTPLGRARVSAGELDTAEANLKEAHAILNEAGGSTEQARIEVLNGLVELFSARHAAEPDQGYDSKAVEWRLKLEERQSSTQPAGS